MSKEKSNPFLYLFKKTWQYSAENQKKMLLCWLMFIIAGSIPLFGQPLAVAKIINTVQTDHGVTWDNFLTLLTLLGLILAIEIVFWALHGPARLMENANAFRVRANYRQHLLKGVMTLPIDWHTEHHSGDTIDKIEKGTSGLYQFSEETFQTIYAGIQLLGSYAMLAYFSPPAGIIVAMMFALTVWITMRFDRVLVAQYKDINRAENSVSESVFDAVSNINTVIVLRVEKLVFHSIMRKVHEPFALVKLNSYINEWKWFATSMCCAFMSTVVLSVYFWQNLGEVEGIMLGSLYILIQYLTRVSQIFFHFTNIYGEVLKRRARVANAEELALDFRSESFSNHVLPENWQTLFIQDMSFSYNGEEGSPHLDGVSLSIVHGERIALVGETGSGKTTLLKVMRDLFHPQSLTLSVDGRIIPQGFEGISRAISLVPQDPEIFATTIIENITLGAEHDPDIVRRFTDMACFTSVAESLPNGFLSSTKEKGVNLSGGQQQRLALSRGLLACADKDIVLLDEPTSSLDTRTEMEVYKNIFREFQGKTIISSIHRLHLLPLFDRICLFENGKIIATGTLDELLSSSPYFISLWEAMKETGIDELQTQTSLPE